MATNSYTPEERAYIKELCLSGKRYSAGTMAKNLNKKFGTNRTRNALVAFFRRNKMLLPRHIVIGHPEKVKAQKTARELQVKSGRVVTAPLMKLHEEFAEESAHGDCKPLEETLNGECRWLYGKSTACARETVKGSYCNYHAGLVFTNHF
jgi:hypothetical protein